MNKMKKVMITTILCISVIIAGCSTTNVDRGLSTSSSGLDFTPKNIQYGRSDEEKSLVWRTLSLPQDGNIKLDIDLPFEFEECRKYGDYPEINNLEAYVHQEGNIMVTVEHGIITNTEKHASFKMNAFADLIEGVKEKELLKKEKRNIAGNDVIYLKCKGKGEQDGRLCIMEFVGVQVDNDYWMISYVYYADDNTMAEIAKRSIESIRIK